MDKKYEFVKDMDIKLEDGTVLHRIKALRDFDYISKGQLGGYIEKEENLSHEGNCWVGGYSKVYGNAKVYGDALVEGMATVYDDARVFGSSDVYGDAKIYGNARIYRTSCVYENARIYGNAHVAGNSRVRGNSSIHGGAHICDSSKICGNAEVFENSYIRGTSYICDESKIYGYASLSDVKVSQDSNIFGNVNIISRSHVSKSISSADDFVIIGPIGSRNDNTTFIRVYDGIDDGIWVTTGCFSGSIESFVSKVKEMHGDNEFARQYSIAIKMAKSLLCK